MIKTVNNKEVKGTLDKQQAYGEEPLQTYNYNILIKCKAKFLVRGVK